MKAQLTAVQAPPTVVVAANDAKKEGLGRLVVAETRVKSCPETQTVFETGKRNGVKSSTLSSLQRMNKFDYPSPLAACTTVTA